MEENKIEPVAEENPLFRFRVALTEREYLDYNLFNGLRSFYSRKRVLFLRVFLALLGCLSVLIILIQEHFTSFYLLIPIVLFFLLFEVLLKPVLTLTVRISIWSIKKQGKMPYAPLSDLLFYDDRLIDATPDLKTELRYSAIERVSVVTGKTVYLHFNGVSACIMPAYSFESAEQYERFIAFIRTKCAAIDLY